VGFAKGIQMILNKKFKTSHDWNRLMLLLNCMRMVCDSTFLIDKETNISPKLVELSEILLEKLQIKNNNRKVIIFSEWTTMLELIGEQLKQNGLAFALFTGKVPIKKRSAIIAEFEQNPECNIMLASEAGTAGLNLQVADTVINFELPWNPAKKNQRIGRIDRIGQNHKTLNVYNLITSNSFEMNILAGLFLKQNLFDGVLSTDKEIDTVNFNDKGKSQFIRQLEAISENKDFNELEKDDLESQESKQQELASDHLQAVSELESLIDNIVVNESTEKHEE
jgi:SNF2 family DNA or RNA helicase